MKKALVMLIVVMLLLTVGCAKPENENSSQISDVAITESETSSVLSEEENISSITTSVDVNTETSSESITIPQITSSLDTTSSEAAVTICTGPPPPASYFKSVAEMLDWIQNDENADCTFKQTVKLLKLDDLLTVESVDDDFKLEEITVCHIYTQINYLFVSKDDKRIHLSIHLPSLNFTANYLETFIAEINLLQQKQYKKCPKIQAGKEVLILGKSRKTYKKDYGQAVVLETGKTTPTYAEFFMDVDGFEVRGSLRGSWRTKNWNNKYLDYFKFSMQSISE